MFLIVTIGGLVLASVCIAVGALLKGKFNNIESAELKESVLRLEEEEDGKERT